MNSEHPTKQRVTSTMIAERAGVSQPTVSRVINNSASVGTETATRVREAMQELGYRQDSSVSENMNLDLMQFQNTMFPTPPTVFPDHRVTTSMVAQRAGVSIATVSRVIHNRLVHARTAEAVRKAIEEIGYLPSLPIARPKRKRTTGNIALLFSGKLMGKP
ncbi:MAG: LacI family DNA-binding transcriptional regulator, partial [Methanothrix sp.]|nr:LacI family DNA-binding transcriptional regulator [Methanothrix sp.]